MNINQMREFIIAAYPGSLTWAARVKKMRDNQIVAIYFKIKNGKLVEREAERNRRVHPPDRLGDRCCTRHRAGYGGRTSTWRLLQHKPVHIPATAHA